MSVQRFPASSQMISKALQIETVRKDTMMAAGYFQKELKQIRKIFREQLDYCCPHVVSPENYSLK